MIDTEIRQVDKEEEVSGRMNPRNETGTNMAVFFKIFPINWTRVLSRI